MWFRSQVLKGEDRGFKLFFDFEPNKYLANKVCDHNLNYYIATWIVTTYMHMWRPPWCCSSLDAACTVGGIQLSVLCCTPGPIAPSPLHQPLLPFLYLTNHPTEMYQPRNKPPHVR